MPRSFIPYVGSKTSLAPEIYRRFPDHTQYVEVFGGAAGVLLQKPRSEVEVYNDVNDDLVTLFRVARDRPDELREWLELTPYSRSEYDRICQEFFSGERPDGEVAHAGWVYYIARTNYGGKLGTKAGLKRDRTDRSYSGEYPNMDAVHSVAARFRGVTLECLDWRDLLEKYDHEDVLFYCDPPYLGAESYYGSGFEHAEFGRRVQELDAAWAVSYGHLPEWATEYAVHELDHSHAIDGGGKDGGEYLITSWDETDSEFTGVSQASLGGYTSE